MKVELKTVPSPDEELAQIRAFSLTEEIRGAIDLLENNCRRLPVIKESEKVFINTDKIYYIESVDKKSYLYTKEDCYETKLRLYEAEQQLSANFFRCSKAMIVNVRKIKAVKSELNGRFRATLLNGEEIIIARSYVKNLKERLGI